DAKFLAYQEADASGVEVWYVSDPIHPEQPAQTSYYPRPGKANVKVRLGVIPVSGGEAIWIDWGAEHYPYLASLRWDRHRPLTLAVQTRDQKELLLLQADPATGKTRRLLTEQDDAWLNLYQGLPRWLEDGSRFLWVAEAREDGDGGPQLELRGPNGDKRVLVWGREGFQGLVDVDEKAGQVVYRASTAPTRAQLFRKPLSGGPAVALTKDEGMHSAVYSKDHSLYVHTF